MTKHFKSYLYFLTLLILAGGFLVWVESISFSNYKFERERTRVNLDIPFIPQAPYAIWDELHDHACEEAAIIMVYYYLTGKELTREIAEQEILNMVDWQIKNWGGHFDLSAEQIIELFKNYYDYQDIEIVDIKDIKKELAQGNPIIIPAAGQFLGNPYFTQPGPEYHILVIKGYDEKKSEFITNDPGTKHGADFRYSYQILENAIHDFNSEDVLNGRKEIIVIKK